MTTDTVRLKQVLEALYDKYNRREYITSDPLMFVYEYESDRDRELAAFIASSLAYGRVAQIKISAANLLGRMGKSPRDFVEGFAGAEKKALEGFKHRFNTGEDFEVLFGAFSELLKEYGSLGAFFTACRNDSDETVLPALTGFVRGIKERAPRKTKSFGYLLADPAAKSPCKRLKMFMRWASRKDDVDPGFWPDVPQSALIVPMDTHMIRLCKLLGLYDSNTVTLKTAVEVTGMFARINPQDPVRYDFALSRVGIVENCNGIGCDYCPACELKSYCSHTKR